MSRAFLLEPTNLPTDKAERFGTVTLLYDHVALHPNPLLPSFSPVVLDKLERLEFDPLVDYVIVSGRMTALIVMVAALVRVFGIIRALVYDSRDAVEDY